MFPEGSKYPYEATRGRPSPSLAPILAEALEPDLDLRATPPPARSTTNPRYGAWDLSSDRANAVRAILGEFGLSDDRLHSP
jgi:chemotaxis protein MotB